MRIYPSDERNCTMLSLEETLIAAAVLVMLLLAIRSFHRKRRDFQTRNATRKLELVLQPRESVKVICPQKKGRVILTNKRILFETKDGFHAILLKNITKVQGINEKGNRTTAIANMVSLLIKADQEYTTKNNCEEFQELARHLLKKNAKKKTSRS